VLTDSGGRSAGRNAAIEAASHDHIVSIDGGCVAEPAWLGRISEPLLAGTDWVAGFYRPRRDFAIHRHRPDHGLRRGRGGLP
jgi:glycosyltransferase involved in cell wall biosynthesis